MTRVRFKELYKKEPFAFLICSGDFLVSDSEGFRKKVNQGAFVGDFNFLLKE